MISSGETHILGEKYSDSSTGRLFKYSSQQFYCVSTESLEKHDIIKYASASVILETDAEYQYERYVLRKQITVLEPDCTQEREILIQALIFFIKTY